MASEDVIELGSSDDEAEPAPKKRKPLPNAMVHIPNKLPGVSIKSSKMNQHRKQKNNLSKPIVISKSVFNVNSNLIKKKQVDGAFQIPIKNLTKGLKPQIPVPNRFSINPLNINKNLIGPKVSVPPIRPIEIKGSKLINKLPPDITIKRVQNAGSSKIIKKCKMSEPQKTVEVLTVEIDDEEISETITEATASPQWYLRPEEPSDKKEQKKLIKDDLDTADSLEKQNNEEPDRTKFVEITIEDSPLKSIQPKHDSEIGKELAIIIEDSPAKVITQTMNNEGSDNESNDRKVPQSKKKLEYPQHMERQVVEIEIDLMETGSLPVDVSDNRDTEKQIINNEHKNTDLNNETTNDDSNIKTLEKDQTKDNVDVITSYNEFHPVYQNFINICFKLENSEDMNKIVEKKIKAYYKQCTKEYVESESFIDMVSSKIISMKADPGKMYLYIKDIVDELNLQRKIVKSTILSKKEDLPEDSSKTPEHDESPYHSKKKRQIRKLEKTIKKLHRAIQKLEEQEVDFDDEEDSVYLLSERYKERMVRVYGKFCQLTKTKMPSEPRIHIESRPGRPTGPARRLEKWINKKVPIGSLLPFPDFHDVLRCVRDSNDEDKLEWTENDIMEEARDLFIRCGKKLQRRRQENEWRLAVSRISYLKDPAEENVVLNTQLNNNRDVAKSKEDELFNKFAEKQKQLKLEAVEIGDNEAEISPEESDEEEEEESVDVSNSLEKKQKRKYKLKKLLQDDNTKDSEMINESTPMKGIEGKNEIMDNEGQEEYNKKTEEIKKSDSISEIGMLNSDTQTECIDNIKVIEKTESSERADKESDNEKVESDVDALHLYQKSRKSFSTVHDAYSSLDSSDSDNPIAISDTLGSESDVETDKKLSDIISIENSSYSESESIIYDTLRRETRNVDNLLNSTIEVKYSIDENVELVENILTASSDKEIANRAEDVVISDTCINLKDDNISISETIVYGKSVEHHCVNNENIFTSENDFSSKILHKNITNSEDNMIIPEYSEEDVNGSLKDTAKDISKCNEEINSNEIESLSEGTSIASIESQTETDNKVGEQIENFGHFEQQEQLEVNDNSCDSKISEVVEPIS